MDDNLFPKEEWHGGLLATIVVTIIVVSMYSITYLWRKMTLWNRR